MTGADPIVVFGGTGHFGRRIVAGLVAGGEAVRVLTRDAERGRRVVGEAPEILQGDVTNSGSIQQALDRARAVVLAISTRSRKEVRRRLRIERDGVLEVLERAPAAGVSRVVYLSGYDVREEFMASLGLREFARPMLDVRAALAESPLNWTVLGCPPSMELFFTLIRGDRMTVPGGGPPLLPTVSPRDVGAVGAQTVLRDDLAGRHLRVTGPEALSFPDAARRIGRVWGRPIRVRAIPLLPLRVATTVTRPILPNLHFVYCAVRLMNHFPQDLAAEVPRDHRRLRELFSYTPTTLEAEAASRMAHLGSGR